MSALLFALVACGGSTPLHVRDDAGGGDADADGDCDPGRWPCRLTGPQCGCHDEERCTIDDEGLRACAPTSGPGGATEGEACGEAGVDDCVDGAVCSAPGAISRVCRRFCEEDVDCSGTGGACAIPFEAAGSPVPDARVCSLDCEPRSGSGCAPETSCQIFAGVDGAPSFTDCSEPLGAGVQGDACDRDAGPHCARGFSCVEGVCRHFCEDPDGMADGCSDYQVCAAFEPPAIIGDVEYGVCQ